MNDEVRESKRIRMKPSVVREAHKKANEEGQTLGRWIEDAIKERIARERKKVK
ncbi:hypothetical protein ES705_22013 [subsurface metagenome]